MDRPWFCDRRDELELLTSRMSQGIHVFVLSPRRYGKSSLIRRGAEVVESGGGRCAYANLLFATNEVELAEIILQAVVQGVLGRAGKARHSLESILRQLRVTPRVSLSLDGRVTIGLDATSVGSSWLEVILDAVTVLEKAAGRRPAVLALDEFQVVASIGRRGVGGAFKALADRAVNTSIVFSGSHLAVMEGLTKGSGAPLHGMGERIVLDVVPKGPMVSFLQSRARACGKRLGPRAAEAVYAGGDRIPNFVQQLALAAFSAAGDDETIEELHVAQGVETILMHSASAYAQQFESLGGAPSQQRILKGLAQEPTARVYAKAFLDAASVANANAVTTALRALDARELVTCRGREWSVADPFLRRWLQRERE